MAAVGLVCRSACLLALETAPFCRAFTTATSIAASSSSSPTLSFLPRLQASDKDDVPTSSSPPAPSVDVSVFRFTLGIPGFDDADLPRIVGIAFGAVLLLNHFLPAGSITPAQWRGSNLNGYQGARPKNVAASMPRSTQIFALSKNLSIEDKENLAWGSYAILKNTKTTSLVIWHEEPLCVRGLWDVPEEAHENALAWLEATLRKSSLLAYDTPTYMPFKAEQLGCEAMPNGIVCCLLLPLKETLGGEHELQQVTKSFVLLLSNIADAFNEKDLLWAELLSSKLLNGFSRA